MSLTTLKDIANYLTRAGGEVMITAGKASLRALVVDFKALVNIQFRSSGVVRVSLALPAKVSDANREVFALELARINRRQLGAAFVLTRSTVVFITQTPTLPDGGVDAQQLDRSIALAVEACREALPSLERIGETGLVSV